MFPLYIPSALEDSQKQLKAGKATLQDSTHQTPERLCQRHSFVCDSAAVEFLRMILEQTGHRAPCVSGTSTHQHHVSSAHKSKFTQVAPRNVLRLRTLIVVEMSLFRKSVCVCVWSLTHCYLFRFTDKTSAARIRLLSQVRTSISRNSAVFSYRQQISCPVV